MKEPEEKSSPCGCIAVLVGLLFIGFCFFIFFSTLPLADALYPVAAKVKFAFTIIFATVIGSCFVYTFLEEFLNWRIVQKKVFHFSVAFLAIIFIIVMVWQYQDPQWVELGNTAFSPQEVTISEGDMMRFANPATGIPQRLCLALGGNCTKIEGGPAELQYPGSPVAPGQTLHVTFPNVGDYLVIRVGRPVLHVLIHVQVRNAGGG